MPLIPEAVIAMLATVRLGAVHSVVFGGKFIKKLFYYLVEEEAFLTLAN